MMHTKSTDRPQVFHRRFPPLDRRRRCGEDRTVVRVPQAVLVAVIALAPLGPAAVARAQVAPGATNAATTASSTTAAGPSPWFRVFLRDGQVLAIVGEATRVDDTVVLQVPVTSADGEALPTTRPVSIAAEEVDWPRTEQYAEALRRARFEHAGGARAYAAFTAEVAATLRDVALVPDPLERIERLEQARARLAQWPAAHHGYRAEDVAQSLSVVDDLLQGMRAAAGQQSFDLTLTSSTTPPAAPALAPLPVPTLQEVIAQALGLAPRIADPNDRLALLEAASSMLSTASGLDRRWVRDHRRQLERQIRKETGVSRAYGRLRTWMLERSASLLATADVRGLMRVREKVIDRDVDLHRQRPGEVASLLATLDVRLDTARRHRLLLDRWAERRPVLERYASAVARHLTADGPLPRALDEIKALAGPDAALLAQAEGELAGARADAAIVGTPEEARSVQALWASALQLATRALQTRRAAVRSGKLPQAWEASAAAAGALLLWQQLRVDVLSLTRPPALPGRGL